MGIDQTFYCGPYIECKWEGVAQTTRVYNCQTDSKHKVTSSDNFCSVCGGKVDFKTIKTGQIVSDVGWDDVNDAVGDNIHEVNLNGQQKTDYYLPNIAIDDLTRSSFGKYEEGMYEITADVITKEITAVEKALSKELAALRSLYKNVRVAWGVLSYCW